MEKEENFLENGFSSENPSFKFQTVNRNDIYSSAVRPSMPIPPKITSSLNKGKSLIKPIAFKPLTRRFPNSEYGSTPILARPSSNLTHYRSSSDLRGQMKNNNNNYASSERKLRSASPIAMSSLPFSVNRKMRYDSLDNLSNTPSEFKNCSPFLKSAFGMIERTSPSEGTGSMLDLMQSPCTDASMVEMEAALRERDHELSYLRQTMEHNEQVIFKVYQEKEHAYEHELRKIKALQESRLRAAAQKSLKLEQMLMMQTYQLQEEKKRLREENEEAGGEISALREEIDSLRLRLEETEWSLCQKSGELAHIKAQLKETRGDHSNKGQELLTMKAKIKSLERSVKEKDDELQALKAQAVKNAEERNVQSDIISLLGQWEKEGLEDNEEEKADWEKEEVGDLMAKIKEKTGRALQKWREERRDWHSERETWHGEKDKVLRYQKQLQLNYVEMFRRNRMLEAEIDHLNLELDLKCQKKRLRSISQSAIQL